jgi:hypothetical protein
VVSKTIKQRANQKAIFDYFVYGLFVRQNWFAPFREIENFGFIQIVSECSYLQNGIFEQLAE